MLDPITMFLQESDQLILYHGSTIQNLKELDKSKAYSYKGRGKEIHATTSKKQAAIFACDWMNVIDEFYGPPGGVWTITISKKKIPLLQKPCSIYIVDPESFSMVTSKYIKKNIDYSTKEDKVRILKEEKYTTALTCLKENGVKIKWTL